MLLKTVIIEDNELERDVLQEYCSSRPEILLINAFSGIKEAADYLEKFQTDLIISDIMVSDGNGTELIRNLTYSPLVVFVSSHRDFAAEAFDLDVVDYIVKPINQERFDHAINKIVSMFSASLINVESKPSFADEFIYVKNSTDITRINLKDILYMESLGNFTRIHLRDDKRIVTLVGLKQLEQKLPESCFMRIHRSYIINFCHIHTINTDEVRLGEYSIPIGKSFKEEFLKRHVYQNLINNNK